MKDRVTYCHTLFIGFSFKITNTNPHLCHSVYIQSNAEAQKPFLLSY